MQARQQIRDLREMAMRLLSLANDLERTQRARPEESRTVTCTCDVCGDQALTDLSGAQCFSWKRDGDRLYRCRGRYWRDVHCRCSECGHETLNLDSCDCVNHSRGCRGVYELAGEPDYVRFKDGRVLNVTIDQLAAQNAAESFHLPLDVPDCPLSDEAVHALADALEMSEEDVA